MRSEEKEPGSEQTANGKGGGRMGYLKKNEEGSKKLLLRIRTDVEQYLPPAYSLKNELNVFLFSFFTALTVSFAYIIKYRNAYNELFVRITASGEITKRIIEGAMMPTFAELIENYMAGFPAMALMCLIVQLLSHFAYHRSGGSQSHYTMKRLPDGYEYIRRCVALPIAEAVAILALGAFVLLIYYVGYMLITPDICIP